MNEGPTDKIVLDTPVIIKSIFNPRKSLPDEIYGRELNTHEKCRSIIRILEDVEVSVHVPKVCVVETAAVARRLANKKLATNISKRVLDS